MAYIVIDSKFKPFNYDELVKPVQQATEAHIALEDKFGELAEKASIWEEMANQETDPKAYAMYKKYADDLQAQADLLASEGLTPGSRKSLLGMKARYSKEILPIEQAYARRKELADEQRKLMVQDGDMMFSTDYSTTSLDTLLKNPSAGYTSYSGKTLFDDSYKMASSIKQSMRSNEREWRGILGDDYYETVMQEGYSPEEILQVLSQDPRGSAVLKQIVEDVVNASGIKSWGDAATIERAYDYARKGLWGAAGKTTFTTLQNIKEKPAGDSGGSGNEKPPKTSTFIRVKNGVDAGKHEDVVKIAGLKDIGNNLLSNNTLDAIMIEYNKVSEGLAQYSEEQIAEFERYRRSQEQAATNTRGAGSYANIGKGMSESIPRGYENYKTIKEKLNKLTAKRDEQIAILSDLEDKYSHFGGTNFENVTKGVELAQTQQSQMNTHLALNISEENYNKVRVGLKNALNSIENDVINKGKEGTGIFAVSNDSKVKKSKVKKGDLQDIKDDKELTVRITEGKDPQLQIVSDGKAYTIEGIEQIDNVNKTLKTVSNFLSDYSKEAIEGNEKIRIPRNEISDIDYANITLGNIDATSIELKTAPLKGTPYHQAILYNPTSRDYIKVLLTPDKKLVCFNTLSDELKGGSIRSEVISNIAVNALLGLQDQVAYKP